MRIKAWSATPRLGDVPANISRINATLEDAELHVWPELFLTGYNLGDQITSVALTPDDGRLGPLQDGVRDAGTHLIVGAPVQEREGVLYNAALCIDAAGRMTWIHKRALPTFATFREGLWFRHGTEQPVWQTRLGSIGVSICYDLYFPEFQKRQVLDGADLLVNISASPSASRRFFEAILPARAIENTVFTAWSNNVGAQDGIVFWGGARVHGPRGDPLAQVAPYEEGAAIVDIDLEDLRPARAFRPTIRDSRMEDLAGLE